MNAALKRLAEKAGLAAKIVESMSERDGDDATIKQLQGIVDQRKAADVDPVDEAWKVLAPYGVTRPAVKTIRVPRVKGGLRTIDSPKLNGMNMIYRLVWKAMYAMADRAPDRTITKRYSDILEAVQRRGGRASVKTVGRAVRYLAAIGVIEMVKAPKRVQDHRGHFTTAPGVYLVRGARCAGGQGDPGESQGEPGAAGEPGGGPTQGSAPPWNIALRVFHRCADSRPW